MALRNRPAAGKHRAHRSTGGDVFAGLGDISQGGQVEQVGRAGPVGQAGHGRQPCARVADHDVAVARRRRPCRTRPSRCAVLRARSKSGNSPWAHAAACAPKTETPYASSTSSIDADQRGFTSIAYAAAAAADEVDAVHAGEVELSRQRRQRAPPPRRPCRRPQEDAAAVLITRCAERGIADELPRDPQRHAAASGRREHHRAGRPLDELLQIAAPREPGAGTPVPHAAAAAGRQGFDEPGWFMVQGSGFRVQGSGFEGAVHCRNREAAFTQRSREE